MTEVLEFASTVQIITSSLTDSGFWAQIFSFLH
jgi:hypothetical protein